MDLLRPVRNWPRRGLHPGHPRRDLPDVRVLDLPALVTLNAMAAGAYLAALMGKNSNAIAAGAMIGAIIAAADHVPPDEVRRHDHGRDLRRRPGREPVRQAALQPDSLGRALSPGLIFFAMLSMILFAAASSSTPASRARSCSCSDPLAHYTSTSRWPPRSPTSSPTCAFILPTVVLIPALVGLLYQQSMFPAPVPAKK